VDRETIELIDKGSEAVASAKKRQGSGRCWARWVALEEESRGRKKQVYIVYYMYYTELHTVQASNSTYIMQSRDHLALSLSYSSSSSSSLLSSITSFYCSSASSPSILYPVPPYSLLLSYISAEFIHPLIAQLPRIPRKLLDSFFLALLTLFESFHIL
jgi:hypothetical protein